jgi:hypothetical protein
MTAPLKDLGPIKGIECKHAVLIPHRNGRDDLHFVKEVVHYENGSQVPRTRMFKNMKRPFFITKKAMRNHEQKKECEKLENVARHMTNQNNLVFAVSMALHGRPPRKRETIRDLANSPYLYGTDMLSTTYLKLKYIKKYGQLSSLYRIAVCDLETNVVDGSDEPIMATLSFGDKIYTAVVKSFLQGIAHPEQELRDAFDEYLSSFDFINDKGENLKRNLIKERNLQWEVDIVDSPVEMLRQLFKRAHEWKPDFLTFWNMKFDISKIIETCEKYGYPVEHLFCDPSVPEEYKYFKFILGRDIKVTASGKKIPIEPSDQWHTVVCPASFYVIDAMCVYRKLRAPTEGKEQTGYSLNAVLTKRVGTRKLHFSKTDHLTGLRWHYEMQTKYKIVYVIYNVFDCVGIELLDGVISDLCISLPNQCGFSDFKSFASQPSRLCDNLTVFLAGPEWNMVWGSTGSEMVTELDELTVTADDWIVTLPAFCVTDNGLQCISDNPELRTNARTHNADEDVTAAYPSNQAVMNLSKMTTMKEICSIDGVGEELKRKQGLNLSAGYVNSVETATRLLGLPIMPDLLDAFIKEKGLPN